MNELTNSKTKFARNAVVGTAALGIALAMNPSAAFAATSQNADALEDMQPDAIQQEADVSAPARNVQEASENLEQAQAQADAANQDVQDAADTANAAYEQMYEAEDAYNAAQDAVAEADAEAQQQFDAAVDDAQAAVDEQQGVVEEAQADYQDAADTTEQAQADLENAQAQESEAKDRLDAAGETGEDLDPEQAYHAVNDADDALTAAQEQSAEAGAQADADEWAAEVAQNDYDEAVQHYADAEEAAQDAAAALQEATTAVKRNQEAYEQADAAYREAERKADETTDALQKAEEELIAARNGLANPEVTGGTPQAQDFTNLADAKAAYDQAKTEWDQAQANLDTATADVNAAQQAYFDAKRALEQAQIEYGKISDSANNTTTNANMDALDKAIRDAQAVYDVASNQKRTAEAEEAAAQENYLRIVEQLEQARKTGTQLNNAYEFYKYIGDAEAMKILETAKYASSTHLGGADARYSLDDATTYYNLKHSIEFLRYCNKLRVQNGLEELQVSTTLMAVAQSNANYEVTMAEPEHAIQFLVNENIAWGRTIYRDDSGNPCGIENPFAGWYDKEKAYYEANVDRFPGARGLPMEKLVNVLPESEIRHVVPPEGCDYWIPTPGGFWQRAGHYLAIVNPNMKYTGFGMVRNAENDTMLFSQTFDKDPYGGKTYTVDEFEIIVDEAFGKTFRTKAEEDALYQLSNAVNPANKELQEKKWATSLANESFEKAQARLQSAIDAKNDALRAQNKANNAASELEQANALVQNAQAKFDAASAQLDQARSNYTDVKGAYWQAKSNYDGALANLNAAQSSLDGAPAATGTIDATQAQARYSDAYYAYAAAYANQEDAQNALDAAKAEFDRAYAQWQESLDAYNMADENNAAAAKDLVDATRELGERETELTQAEAKAQESRAAADAAEAAVDAAQTAYEQALERMDVAENGGWGAFAEACEQAKAETQDAADAYAKAMEDLESKGQILNQANADLAMLQDRLSRAQDLVYNGVDTATINDPDFAYLNDYAQAVRDAYAAAQEAASDLADAQDAVIVAEDMFREASNSYIDALAELAVAQDTYNRFAGEYALNDRVAVPTIDVHGNTPQHRTVATSDKAMVAHQTEAANQVAHQTQTTPQMQVVAPATFATNDAVYETPSTYVPSTPANPNKDAKATTKAKKAPKTLSNDLEKHTSTTPSAQTQVAENTANDGPNPLIPAGAALGALGMLGAAAAIRTRRVDPAF